MKPMFAAMLLAMLTHLPAHAEPTMNGFDLAGASIPIDQIHPGGPPRDGIPAIDDPRFVTAGEADFLRPDSRVIGLSVDGEARAYPLAILNWHEVVNDRIGATAVAITYCPLCGTGVVYRSARNDQPFRLGVSGLLYNSDVLLYDRQTESLWSQLLHTAVTGPMNGRRLEVVPSQLTLWSDWRAAHPETRVLSDDTGFDRDYRRNPYSGYDESPALHFPVAFLSRRYHPKERVLGVELDGTFHAYPFAELGKDRDRDVLFDTAAGRRLRIEYDAVARSGRIFGEAGEELPVVNAFWFAWFAFHPETGVYQAEEPTESIEPTEERPPH